MMTEKSTYMQVNIEHIILSPDHNYVGHFGKPPGENPAIHQSSVRLLAGRGIEGDRYAQREPGHPKQITFFDMDVIDALSSHFGRKIPSRAVWRSVFVCGLVRRSLIGYEFSLNGIRFLGVQDCKPCFWMDDAIGSGAEEFLAGKGGLRAKILDDGELGVGRVIFNGNPPANGMDW